VAGVIPTERLDLLSLSPDLLRLMKQGELAQIERHLEARVPEG
jgi:hypothetical protein